jgi:translocation and assembly module TamA
LRLQRLALFARRLISGCILAFGIGAAARADIPYRVDLAIEAPAALADRLRSVSDLLRLDDRPPSTAIGLRRRTEADRQRFETLLRAAGHYAPRIEASFDFAMSPALVRMTVAVGPLYRFGVVEAQRFGRGEPMPIAATMAMEERGLATGRPAESQAVLDSETALRTLFAESGHPLARIAERVAIVRHESQTMDVRIVVDAGPAARFGPVAIRGVERVSERYVRFRLAWRAGEPFDARLLERTRRDLVDTGLFNSVRLESADRLDENGAIAIVVALEERPVRSIGAGVSYASDDGFGVRGLWEHRSIFGGAELFRLRAQASQNLQGVTTDFRSPDLFATRGLDLVGNIDLARENPVAFRVLRARGFGGLEYKIRRTLTVGIGLESEISRTFRSTLQRRAEGGQTYKLFGLPLSARWDTTDDLLDPTRGVRVNIVVTPTTLIGQSSGRYVSTRAAASAYYGLGEKRRTVLAGWGLVGAIAGAPTIDVPSDRRFYAGGGGSVRAFGYQRIAPRDAEGRPTGGRSIIAFGTEVRQRILESWGVGAFVEGGTVSNESVPSFADRLSIGGGLGVIYYTPIGPLRADVAFPFNRRPGDGRLQFYINIGQSF